MITVHRHNNKEPKHEARQPAYILSVCQGFTGFTVWQDIKWRRWMVRSSAWVYIFNYVTWLVSVLSSSYVCLFTTLSLLKKTGEQRIWIWIIHKRSKISADSFTDSWGPENGRSFFPNLQKTCRGYRNPAFIIPWWYCSQISQAQGLQWLPCNKTIQNTHFLPVHWAGVNNPKHQLPSCLLSWCEQSKTPTSFLFTDWAGVNNPKHPLPSCSLGLGEQSRTPTIQNTHFLPVHWAGAGDCNAQHAPCLYLTLVNESNTQLLMFSF